MNRNGNIIKTSHLTIKDKNGNTIYDKDFESVIMVKGKEIIIETDSGSAIVKKELVQKICSVQYGKDLYTGESVRFVSSNVDCVFICGKPADRVLIFE